MEGEQPMKGNQPKESTKQILEGKQTRGRQKIEMKKIESEDDRYASFSKRKNGIFKKASEMCTLCQVDIGIIIFSPTGKPFSFFHPNMEKVVNRFYKRDPPSDLTDQLIEANVRANIDRLNKQLDKLEKQKEIEEKRSKELDKLSAPKNRFAWLDTPIEEMNREMVNGLKSWINEMLVQSNDHANELKNGASSSAVPPPSESNYGASSSTVPPPNKSNDGASSSSVPAQEDFDS